MRKSQTKKYKIKGFFFFEHLSFFWTGNFCIKVVFNLKYLTATDNTKLIFVFFYLKTKIENKHCFDFAQTPNQNYEKYFNSFAAQSIFQLSTPIPPISPFPTILTISVDVHRFNQFNLIKWKSICRKNELLF